MNSGENALSTKCEEVRSLLAKDPAAAYLAAGTSEEPMCIYYKAVLLAAGEGISRDREKALELLDSVSADCAPAAIVADELRSGKDVDSILKLRIRAEGRDLEACREIFPLYDTGKNADGSKAVVRKDHVEAVRLYTPCADAGDHEAEETIGFMYLMGKGVQKDRDLALSLLERAYEGGIARAAYRIAYMYDTGQCYTDPDLDKAVIWYEKAAAMGYPHACFQLAGIMFMKDSKWSDSRAAQDYLVKAAEAGDHDAEHQLGIMYAYGANGFKRDVKKAKLYLEKACEAGVQDAQVAYANMCFEGQVLPQDMAAAAKWFGEAAKTFSGTAMYALGCMYANGYHFAEDNKKAAEYFVEAAEGGEVNAQYALACFYYAGRGIEKDMKKSAVWFQEAADQGHPGAMAFLGMFKVTGRDIEQDIPGGLKLLNTAADGGYYEAQFYLGKLYAEGEYVKKDLAYAKKMLQLAAKQGDPDAAAMLDDIKKKRIR